MVSTPRGTSARYFSVSRSCGVRPCSLSGGYHLVHADRVFIAVDDLLRLPSTAGPSKAERQEPEATQSGQSGVQLELSHRAGQRFGLLPVPGNRRPQVARGVWMDVQIVGSPGGYTVWSRRPVENTANTDWATCHLFTRKPPN